MLWDALGCSEMLGDLLGWPEMTWDDLGRSGIAPGGSGTVWDALPMDFGCGSAIYWEPQPTPKKKDSSKILLRFLGCSGMLLDALRCSEMAWVGFRVRQCHLPESASDSQTKILWGVLSRFLGHSRMLWDALGCSGMLWEASDDTHERAIALIATPGGNQGDDHQRHL